MMAPAKQPQPPVIMFIVFCCVVAFCGNPHEVKTHATATRAKPPHYIQSNGFKQAPGRRYKHWKKPRLL